MQKFWMCGGSNASLTYQLQLMDKVPPTFAVLNIEAMIRHGSSMLLGYVDHDIWEINHQVFRTAPIPILAISEPGFGLDYFAQGLYEFVSARLRAAFDVHETVVAYRDVDATRSVQSVKDRDYRIFSVLRTGQPFDEARSLGGLQDLRDESGVVHRVWLPAIMSEQFRSKFFIKPDFIAPAPIFRPIGTPFMFATDEFAQRVRAAGIDDFAFSAVGED